MHTAVKHAISVLTEGLRRELRDLGTKIRVTVSAAPLSPFSINYISVFFPVAEHKSWLCAHRLVGG